MLRRKGQPRVIGEILGGLMLGPTVLGFINHSWYESFFILNSKTGVVLALIYQLGLLLLMFCSGIEIRSLFRREEIKTVTFITIAGTVFPFLLGFAATLFVNAEKFLGSAANKTAFTLVFAIGIAVTSIPVISKILHDLNLLKTKFARIVLGSALIEDVILYILLSIAVSLVSLPKDDNFGIPALLSPNTSLVYHVVITLLFFLCSLRFGPIILRAVQASRYNLLQKSSPLAFLLLFLFILCGIALLLGITPMLGAFMAGIIVGQSSEKPEEARQAISTFSYGFFIPVYFGLVGLKLDLIHHFPIVAFLVFFLFACVVKMVSVAVGTWGAGVKKNMTLHYAVAMNARGGPGIVLASIAFDAGIINLNFYSILIMLSLLTSYLAGAWLSWAIAPNSKMPLYTDE